MVMEEVRPAGALDSRERSWAVAVFRKHWRLFAALFVVVLLVVGGVAGYRWRNGLHLFGPAGVGVVSGPIAIGETYFADANFGIAGHGAIVDIRSASPHITRNTAGASYEVLTCHKGGTNILGRVTTSTGMCADRPVRLHAGKYDLGDVAGKVTIVIRFTARSAGAFEFHGVDVTYEVGWRHGQQWTGIDQQYRAS